MGYSLGICVSKHYNETLTVEQIEEKAAKNRRRNEGKNGGELAVFSRVTIGELDLNGIDLSGAIFNEVHFNKTKLVGAKLTKVKFIECDFDEADMSGADLSGAKFINSTMFFAVLKNANMESADLYSTTIWASDFEGVYAPSVRFTFSSVADGGFENAKLQKSAFAFTDLDYAQFTGADCKEANFLCNYNADYANFDGADLTDAYFQAHDKRRKQRKKKKDE